MKVRTPLIIGALLGFGACTEDEPEDWGTIHLELQQENATDMPFVGTQKIIVQAAYKECLIDFYTVSNTEYALEGVEGPAIFEEWSTRLCDSGEFAQVIDCEISGVDAFAQDFAGAIPDLQITYTVLDDTSLQGADIRVGPLPTDRITSGCTPTVDVSRQASVLGRDANDNQLWSVATTQNATSVATNQGAPARINVKKD